MLYLLYISTAFIALQLFNVLLNFLFRQKIENTDKQNSSMLSVLIPARNEEANIGQLIKKLHNMKNEHIEIIVCDDNSEDNTVQIVHEYCKKDHRIQVILSDTLPTEWLGKNHACFQLARKARGNYFLFVDADVMLHSNILADAVSYMEKHRLGLLSVFPKQIQQTLGEKTSVPIMNYILLTLLPLVFVRVSPFKSHAAANGQFMLFDAETYKRLQPHEQFKKSAVEDIEIARFFKHHKIKTACITGETRIECRMYNSYQEALNGFSKNIFMFFGNIPVLAFIFWTCAALGFLPFVMLRQQLLPEYLIAIVLIQVLYATSCKQSVFYTLLLFPVHLAFMLQVMVKALTVKHNKGYVWKGRNIY